MDGPHLPFISVKLTPVGRAQSFRAGDVPAGRLPRAGEQVVVQTDGGPAVGTVVRAIPQLADRRTPADDSPNRVVRLATHDDIVSRLKHQQREKEAHRIALLKIQERGLGMKLTRVEQAFDGSRIVFSFTAEIGHGSLILVHRISLGQPVTRDGRRSFASTPTPTEAPCAPDPINNEIADRPDSNTRTPRAAHRPSQGGP